MLYGANLMVIGIWDFDREMDKHGISHKFPGKICENMLFSLDPKGEGDNTQKKNREKFFRAKSYRRLSA